MIDAMDTDQRHFYQIQTNLPGFPITAFFPTQNAVAGMRSIYLLFRKINPVIPGILWIHFHPAIQQDTTLMELHRHDHIRSIHSF